MDSLQGFRLRTPLCVEEAAATAVRNLALTAPDDNL